MPIRRFEKEYMGGRWGNQLMRSSFAEIVCDHCGKRKEVPFKPSQHLPHRAFCDKRCKLAADRSGLLNADRKVTCLKKYSVEFSSQVSGASEKMIETRIRNTGASCPADKTSSSNIRWRQTMVERLGVNHPSQNADVLEKKRKTWFSKYGVGNPLASGSPFRLSSEELSIVGQKGYAALYQKMKDKMLSKPEQGLKDWLINRFGENEIRGQVEINHGARKPWLIDFYVVPIDIYIMLDGVFWHGLDRPFEQLHERAKKNYLNDRAMDEWFLGFGKKLVRITDLEFLQTQKSLDFSGILYKLGG